MADKFLTACMVEDLIHDPVLAAQVLLGEEFPPHQELRLWAMWTKPYFFDSSGFGTGKTRLIAVCAALRCMLLANRVCGLLSRSFPQGQLIHKYFDIWEATQPIFRSQLDLPSIHSHAAWSHRFKSGSETRTIPPDWKGQGERAGSEDWTDGFFDEITKYPSIEIFNRQFGTRVRKPIDPQYPARHPIFTQHLYFCGTAKPVWHPAYARVKQYLKEIAGGSTEHAVQAWNYKQVPERFYRLINPGVYRDAEMAMTREQAKQEVYGIWTKDTDGWYNYADIERSREAGVKAGIPILTKREE